MKTILKLAAFAALCSPAFAQTWFTVIPATQQARSLSATLPAGTSYRFLSLNGKTTGTLTATAAPVSDWDDGSIGHDPDPEKGVSKSLQVLQSAAFSVSIIDNSVKPAKTTSVSVPALPASYTLTCTGMGTITGTTFTSTNMTCTGAKQ
jgi:hypothetical protein